MERTSTWTRPTAVGSALLTGLLLSLGAASCGGSNEDETATSSDVAATQQAGAPASTAGLVRATSSKGSFDVTIMPDGGRFPLNQPFGVSVALLESGTDVPLSQFDAATIDARMPAHSHGMNRDVELVRQPDGTFRAEGMLLHMVGHWEIHVDVTRGPKVERAQTSVNLKF